MKKAKPWQQHALNSLRRALNAQHTAFLLQLPPGSGKTLVAVRLFASLRKSGYRLLVAVPSRRLIESGSWKKELKPLYPDELDPAQAWKSHDRVIEHAYPLTHRQLSCILAGKGPLTPRKWFKERKKILVVVDEIHKARSLRLSLSDAFSDETDINLPKLLRQRPGPKPSRVLWLFLSATPYNPVKLDYDIDRQGDETAPESDDVEKEARVIADEVRDTLCSLAYLDRQHAKRDRIDKYVAQLTDALRNPDRVSPRTSVVCIVPSSTADLRPRCPRMYKLCRNAADLPKCIGSLWNIHGRLKHAVSHGCRIATAERLILGGVRWSPRSKKRLCGHNYSTSTMRAVRIAQPPRSHKLLMPKLAALAALVNDLRKRHNLKVVIFCVHRATATAVSRHLRSQAYAGRLAIFDATKASSAATLKAKCDSFNEKCKPPFVVVATDVLSESIDLHEACHTLIHFELPWSPLRVIQRVGRVWRIRGDRQTKVSRAPTVYHVVHPASVEEEILNRLNRRWGYLKALGLDYISPDDAMGTRLPTVPRDWTP